MRSNPYIIQRGTKKYKIFFIKELQSELFNKEIASDLRLGERARARYKQVLLNFIFRYNACLFVFRLTPTPRVCPDACE